MWSSTVCEWRVELREVNGRIVSCSRNKGGGAELSVCVLKIETLKSKTKE